MSPCIPFLRKKVIKSFKLLSFIVPLKFTFFNLEHMFSLGKEKKKE